VIKQRHIFRGHHASGFTLLEVLVVLMIVSLISVVLMQGMGLMLNLRDNFGDQMVGLDRETVKRNLVRQPLMGLIPDFSEGENVFLGTADALSGLTIQPLLRRAGRSIPFSYSLEYDSAERMNTLLYREDQDPPMTIASWEGERAYFRFIGDTTTGWVESWPPDQEFPANPGQITEIRPPQIPELIYLVTGSKDEMDYAVPILTRRNRVPRDPPIFGS